VGGVGASGWSGGQWVEWGPGNRPSRAGGPKAVSHFSSTGTPK